MDKEKLKLLIERIVEEEIIDLTESYKDDVVYKAFVQPFKDVIDTAAYGLKKIGTTTIRGGIKLAKQTTAAFLPFMTRTITQIGKDEERKIQNKLAQIDKQYADVLKRNWDTLRTTDVSFLMFLMDPKVYLGSTVALKAPEIAFNVLDSMIDNPTVSKWHNTFKELNKRVLPPTSGGSGPGGGIGSGGMSYLDDGPTGWEAVGKKGYLIKEQFTKDQLNKKAFITLKRFLSNNKIKKQIDDSPKVKEIRKDALLIFVDKINQVKSFDKIEDFKNYFGPEFQSTYEKTIQNIPPEELQNYNLQLIEELKIKAVEMVVNFLNNLRNDIPSADAEISDTLTKIKSL